MNLILLHFFRKHVFTIICRLQTGEQIYRRYQEFINSSKACTKKGVSSQTWAVAIETFTAD